MATFCVIKDNDKKFDCNVDREFQYNPRDEYKGKWVPPKLRRRKFGYVTYRVTNESKHFPDSKFEDKALAIALRQWGLRTRDIRFKRVTGTADIEMKFETKDNDKMFRDRPGTLAYAYFPNGQKIGGDIWLDPDIKLNHVGQYVFSGNTKALFK